MKILNRSASVLITALIATAESAYGQQPPDVVISGPGGNTAMGTEALWALNVVGGGNSNTAAGDFALYSNTTGENNTGIGTGVLYFNTTGTFNTALGSYSLWWNADGHYNTATGTQVLYGVAPSGTYPNGSTGSYNTGTGAQALYSYSTGSHNTATGLNALYSDTTGNNNTANGSGALDSNTTGSNNVAEGHLAGQNLTTGSNNIDIGNQGATGDTNTIKIGTEGTQTRTYIAGIYNNSQVRGLPVVINSQGELGMLFSSERFKAAIAPMRSNSAKLGKLRPVTFHLKSEPNGALQYGLIAEEVAKVYPELVIRNESGRIDGVRYDELAPMLLNEAQQQKKKINAQAAKIRDLKLQQLRMQQQVAELKDLNQATQAVLRRLEAKDELVAER